MAVLKEYVCAAHGPFEAFVKSDEMGVCPKGCSKRFVKREFRTAPAIKNVVTGTLDGHQRALAHQFGLGDLKVGKDDGKSVMQNLREKEDFSPKWHDVPGRMAPGWSQRGEKPAPVAPQAAFGMQGGNALVGSNTPKQIPTEVVGRHKATDTL
jgi:hypothetical protein